MALSLSALHPPPHGSMGSWVCPPHYSARRHCSSGLHLLTLDDCMVNSASLIFPETVLISSPATQGLRLAFNYVQGPLPGLFLRCQQHSPITALTHPSPTPILASVHGAVPQESVPTLSHILSNNHNLTPVGCHVDFSLNHLTHKSISYFKVSLCSSVDFLYASLLLLLLFGTGD